MNEHGKQTSTHYSATFAFKIAKEDGRKIATKIGLDIKQPSKVLAKDPKFSEIFKKSKDRVSKMKIKVIEISDPIEQTLFEVYAALELKTPYNEWETH